MEGTALAYTDRVRGFISEYEMVILGNKAHMSYWCCTGVPEYDEKLALEVFRYAFEKLLKWTPEMIYECEDIAVWEKMNLVALYKAKIIHPKGHGGSCFQLIASKLYPDRFKADPASVLDTYKKVLDGELERLPKNIFSTEDGILKLGYCVRYILTEKMTYSCVQDLYDRFSAPGINSELDKFKLLKFYPMFFETPVDMLHYCLPKSLRDDKYFYQSKRKYIKYRLASGGRKWFVREYKSFLLCTTANDPMKDSTGNYRADAISSVFHYFIDTLLPNDPIIKQEEYDFTDRNTLYIIFSRPDIDFILDKYRILEMVRALSTNYVDAVDLLLYGDDRDEECYQYASRKFASIHKTDYVPLPMLVRKYLAAVSQHGKVSKIICSKEDLDTILYYLSKHVVPYFEEYKGKSISDLLQNKDFLDQYRLEDVIKYYN